ncbi:hypothetical protein NDU88_006589 [Pleurodeles waltl]|uniref:Uncharacterized protein n=1 Tax=Pleurodeles waltl TaxID=8319 RepID=A0AAV7L4J9_PLEWA|nr:hypothetical protein NDU88_006589 [Pleurodeles waltl]
MERSLLVTCGEEAGLAAVASGYRWRGVSLVVTCAESRQGLLLGPQAIDGELLKRSESAGDVCREQAGLAAGASGFRWRGVSLLVTCREEAGLAAVASGYRWIGLSLLVTCGESRQGLLLWHQGIDGELLKRSESAGNLWREHAGLAAGASGYRWRGMSLLVTCREQAGLAAVASGYRRRGVSLLVTCTEQAGLAAVASGYRWRGGSLLVTCGESRQGLLLWPQGIDGELLKRSEPAGNMWREQAGLAAGASGYRWIGVSLLVMCGESRQDLLLGLQGIDGEE